MIRWRSSVLTPSREQVVLCAEGEPRMPVLAAPGHVRFFMDGAEVSLPEERWTLADHGENWLLFAAGSEDAGARVLLRYAWMDHERLVLDIAAEGAGADRLTCRTDFAFTLGGGADSAYRLSLYGCQAEVTDENGMLLPEADAEAEVAGQIMFSHRMETLRVLVQEMKYCLMKPDYQNETVLKDFFSDEALADRSALIGKVEYWNFIFEHLAGDRTDAAQA